MGLLVQKFGGTSVGSTESIKNVAIKVKAERDFMELYLFNKLF